LKDTLMDLDGAYDPANLFAKMLRGEIASVKVFEDEVALAIMDIFPQAPGHTLVIAKTPARNFLDLPAAAVGPYLERVQKIAHGVRKALEPDGLQIKQYNGAAAGQSVFHVHFHIIPRWADMDIAPHGGGKADIAELQEQAAKIADALS
jgi:histidine triad (HIT) family protein